MCQGNACFTIDACRVRCLPCRVFSHLRESGVQGSSEEIMLSADPNSSMLESYSFLVRGHTLVESAILFL